MIYARARLWLGISGVGFWVLLALIFLWLGLPARLFGSPAQSVLTDIQALAAVLGAYILLSAPFDWLGGYALPHRFQRPAPKLGKFLSGWLRGVMVQGVVLFGIGLILLAAGRAGGRFGALGAVAGLMLALLWMQGGLAQLIGGLRATVIDLSRYETILSAWDIRLPKTVIFDGNDPAFVGGLVGLPGGERLVLPAIWLREINGVVRFGGLPHDAVALQIARRVGVLERGSRWRGVALALSWNLLGFALALWLPGAGATTVAELVTTACGFTLWSFVGLLMLPSLSRPGVFEGDHFALEKGVSVPLLERTVTALDKWQDDEPARQPTIETIFHPIPSVSRRLNFIAQGERAPRGAWQAARIALFLSWGGWGFLSRAVHCNSGRPELWALFPGD